MRKWQRPASWVTAAYGYHYLGDSAYRVVIACDEAMAQTLAQIRSLPEVAR